jgi:periplasmic protein CpxP/Spy
MSRFASLMTAVCFPLLMVAAISFAQPPQGGGPQSPRGGPGFQPNADRMVEWLNRELTLNADQQKKIKALYEKAFKSATQSGDSAATGVAARRQRMAQQNTAQDDFRKRMEQTNAEIKKALTPDQQKKFDVLIQRSRGGMSVENRIARLDERLKLSPDQKKKLQAIFEKQNQAMQKRFEEMRQGSGDSQSARDSMRKNMEADRAKNQKEVEAILTPDQKKTYQTMQAEMEQQRQQREQQRQGGDDGPPRQ